ncbi:MAG TPA: glycosyltransferase [Kineosporiaceae bacterium]
MEPVLSVIIACRNAADTLGTQLAALAAQPCPVPWELLICDNGSTDGSTEVARSFADRIPELRIIDASADRGAGPARNLGVERSRGAWLAFCDADDEVAPDWLAAMCRALARHRFVAGRFESSRLNGCRVLRSRPLQQQDGLQTSPIGVALPHAGGGNLGMHRADFVRLGGFDRAIRWLEDTDLSWRAQLAGIPLVFCPDVVVHVRLRRTFRSMVVQGWQYGVAQAWLEERYGMGPTGSTGPSRVADAAAVGGARPALRARRVGTWLVDHLIGGRLCWRVGWVVGHRSRRRRGLRGAPPTTAVTRSPLVPG